jgi:glycosyltransferase involved in cell wall biosynthesis
LKALPPKISIVVPTKNEEGAIAGVIRDCREALQGIDHEIIVVDESGDNTAVEAEKAGARVVRQVGRGGAGDALIQGFYCSRGDCIVFFDGDGTYDPADIHRLIPPLFENQADLVNGNRFADMEKGAMSFTNKIGNRLLTWMGNLMFHTSIRDSQSGMKGFTRDFLRRVTLLERGFPINSEILAEASKAGLRVSEVGITYRSRIGKSKLNPASAGLKIFWASLLMLRDYNPLLLFAAIGFVLELLGFLVTWDVILEYVTEGTFTFVGHAMLGILFWLAGLVSIFTGIILDTVNYSIRRIEKRASKT